jgi:endonuclease YncB( thermonuclease family)
MRPENLSSYPPLPTRKTRLPAISTLCVTMLHRIMKYPKRLTLGIVLLMSPIAAADTLPGRAARVTDGDTIVILDAGNAQHEIRLQGIDSPERGQAYGTKSKEHLSELLAGRFVVVESLTNTTGLAAPSAKCS